MNDREKCPSGSSSGPVYAVEARRSDAMLPPETVGDQIFDTAWRQVDFAAARFGVPTGEFILNRVALDHGFVKYETAMALAWWFLAAVKWGGFEVRLVEYQFEVNYSAERRADGEPFSQFHSRIEKRA